MHIKEDRIVQKKFSIPNVFEHLCKFYVKGIKSDLLSNKETISKHWDPDAPIQTIYKQLEDGVKFAKLA